MSDEKEKKSSKKTKNEYGIEISNKELEKLKEALINYSFYTENINKDILLQVRIDEKYNKKLNILEEVLNENRSTIIRKAIDNLYDTHMMNSREENREKHRNELRKERAQEEIIMLLKSLLEICKVTNIEEYIKAIDIKLNILEETKK